MDSCVKDNFSSVCPVCAFQHYPLYRASDSKCTGVDAAPPNERYKQFHERYDVLSQDASKMLLWWFQPRLILSGHTHSGCEFLHENRFPEVSVPSFSWRNRNNPSFILVTITSLLIYLKLHNIKNLRALTQYHNKSKLTCMKSKGSFSQSDFALSKCFLPEESSVIAVYCGSVLVIALITLSHLSVFRRALRLANRLLGKQKSI
ncbi:hypothetical protein P4O66_004953 [Electrophorus voltai]|uniref:Metallophosphoesterase 1 n=1 Tax=Electrophorus voltai TaxID=2609070 RepID=A0AAD8ZWG1_9TELE|nr:hypothetical protein P4O66_004953 [Electrophorus voltai]